jgi:hypothetical protein
MSASKRMIGWASRTDLRIWWHAFGYFASYVPYSALTKALSKGAFGGMTRPLTGIEILPVSVLASVVGMFTFITLKGWWKHATHSRILGLSLPHPTRWTFLSGLCTSAIIATTTLAYTFKGVSIVFVMLLMRGGLLILAPIVDALGRRKVRWFSWMGFLLSFSALFVAMSSKTDYDITLLCAIDVGVYLLSYFIRLRFMTRLAKSEDGNANIRYFVEEQMVATTALVFVMAIAAATAGGTLGTELTRGFTEAWSSPVLVHLLLVGLFSQGTGIYGGLILLDRNENTYCVPVNRCSSVLAGVVATYALSLFLRQPPPARGELIGAMLIIAAILFLTIPPAIRARREKTRARLAAQAAHVG